MTDKTKLLTPLRFSVGLGTEVDVGKELDLDDVAAQSPKALEELAELREGFERYETARRMNPRAWTEAWNVNIKTGKPFDEIIDQLKPFVRPNVKLRGSPLLGCPARMQG